MRKLAIVLSASVAAGSVHAGTAKIPALNGLLKTAGAPSPVVSLANDLSSSFAEAPVLSAPTLAVPPASPELLPAASESVQAEDASPSSVAALEKARSIAEAFMPERTEPQPLSRAAAVFGALPSPVRSFLAKRSAGLKSYQAGKLNREISELIPPEAVAFMAYMPQTSYSYLTHEFPEIAGVKAAARRRAEREGSLSVRLAVSDAHEVAWLKRLRLARAKLMELESLQGSKTPDIDRALTHLSLALMEGFTYGFPQRMEQEKAYVAHETFDGRDGRPRVEAATRYYREALKLLEKDPSADPRVVLLTKFLLGKHAVSASSVYSNAGRYTMDWRPIPPEPETARYASLARETLSEVAASRDAMPEIRFEARYHLLRLERSRQNPAALEDLLFDVLSEGSPEWLESQVKNRYGIIFRLVNDLRWALHGNSAEMNDAMFRIERSIDTTAPGLTYEDLVRRLVEEVGIERFRPLKPRKSPARLD